MKAKNLGRPPSSHNMRLTPEFRENPDIEKLGRALIAIANALAEKKKAAGQAPNACAGKGDGVP